MKEKFDDKDLDQLFRDKFSGEETAPREIVWTKINERLGEKDRRPGAWIWWLSGLILVGGISLFLLYGTNQNTKLAVLSDSVTKENSIDKKNEVKSIAETKQSTKNNSDSANKIISTDNDWNSQYETDSVVKKNIDEKNNIDKNVSENKTVSNQHSKTNSSIPDKSNTTNNSHSPAIHSQTPNSSAKSHKQNPQTQIPSANDGMLNPSPANSAASTNSSTTNTAKTNSNVNDTAVKNPFSANTFAVNQNITPEAKQHLDSIFSPKTQSVTTTIFNSHPDFVPVLTENYPPVKLDSAKLYSDTSNLIQPNVEQFFPVAIEPAFLFPKYFAGFHAAVDAGKILQSEVNDDDYSTNDVAVYDETKLKSLPQQTYSFGARFGWFLNKRIALTGGAYYSIFESSGNEGKFKFNHNDSYTFSMHSATSSVECPSSKFDAYDCYHMNFDTCYVAVNSEERYDYVNLQLGFSFYALRTKHFGLYADLLSNGAILSKQQMTLTVPVSGKTFAYSGNQLTGMSKFVTGAQAGIGFEYLPFGNFGLWVEPSFYFSGSLNKQNAVSLRPGGTRYLFGLIYHF